MRIPAKLAFSWKYTSYVILGALGFVENGGDSKLAMARMWMEGKDSCEGRRRMQGGRGEEASREVGQWWRELYILRERQLNGDVWM